MARPVTALLTSGGLVGGFAAARYTHRRSFGGAVLAVAGVVCGRRWATTVGPGRTAVLVGVYLGGFGGSHALAKKIGAWPAVGVVAGVSALASWVLADRSGANRALTR